MDLGATGEDNVYGTGFVDAYAAVQMAITGFGRLEGTVRNASYDDLPIGGATVELVDRAFSFTADEAWSVQRHGGCGGLHRAGQPSGLRAAGSDRGDRQR